MYFEMEGVVVMPHTTLNPIGSVGGRSEKSVAKVIEALFGWASSGSKALPFSKSLVKVIFGKAF